MTETSELKRKKLLYRASHRGFKEADILVGTFVKANIQAFTVPELQELEVMLEHPDNDLYDWFMGKAEVPESVKSSILQKFLQHKVPV